MNFCFVILHYKTADDTINCINSIEKLQIPEGCQVNTVVVDNASDNGSLEKLQELYSSSSNVIFIKNNENLGFARGNNVGYDYARNVLKADFIAVLNNDIIVDSKDIISRTIDIYKEYNFGIMGPDIESLIDGGHQNPAYKNGTDIGVIKKNIRRFKLLLLLSRLNIYDPLQKVLGTKKTPATIKKKQETVEKDIQLHGSFLIFSPIYIEAESFAFYSKTFLYCEEAILYYHCLDKGYTTLYHPDIKVYHKEDSSTAFTTQTSKKKREFVFKNYIDAQEIYVEFLQNKGLWK